MYSYYCVQLCSIIGPYYDILCTVYIIISLPILSSYFAPNFGSGSWLLSFLSKEREGHVILQNAPPKSINVNPKNPGKGHQTS